MNTKTEITVRADSTSLPALAPPRHGVEPPDVELSEQQTHALELIMTGESFKEIADKVNIDRGTLYRWRTTDPNFIAALNRWRAEVQQNTRDQVVALSREAVKSLSHVFQRHQGSAEMKLLDKLGYLKHGPTRPVDPHAVFGNGIEDETERWAIAEAFMRAESAMTPDQVRRAPRMLALAVIAENQQTRRESPQALLEVAGLHPADPPPEPRPAPVQVSVKVKASITIRRTEGAPAIRNRSVSPRR
jgi:hypothetical protein